MCVMNPLLCHGEVLDCDPFIHEFQCSKHQDKHSWFCFGVLVDLCIDIAIPPLDEVFLDLLRFRRLIISCSFAMQLCILGSYILLNGFLLIIPFFLV